MPQSPVPSPCIKICRLDAERRCTGCHRTLDEIAAWPTMPDQERLEILERCRARAQEDA